MVEKIHSFNVKAGGKYRNRLALNRWNITSPLIGTVLRDIGCMCHTQIR
jgi:hypothetical protein